MVGGAARTPGAVQLAGLAALRVGAGHLSLAVADPVAAALAVATPEAGVSGLASDDAGSVLPDGVPGLAAELGKSDAVVIGPGLDNPDLTGRVVGSALSCSGRRPVWCWTRSPSASCPTLGRSRGSWRPGPS